ncbi:hypothetical protein FOZ60_004264 [Perkinsus olseni]|uniref:Transposase Tc1-like domain-containing protein n=1 Tax=Perkinsus olseni TaxID=32597 RepID=A0A7J6NTJ3_PEROL|nr:hypothetical protein FOZ60_004264 [Perkinsus olseni]
MGRGKLLTTSERASIVKQLSQGVSVGEIAKKLGRDTRTVKEYVSQPEKEYKRPKGAYKTSVTSKEKTRLKRALAQNPLASSKRIFDEAGVTPKGKTTRNKVLEEIGKVVKPRPRPSLTQKHKKDRLDWARANLKRDFSTVIWTDEARATLDGPDNWATGWILNGSTTPVRVRLWLTASSQGRSREELVTRLSP